MKGTRWVEHGRDEICIQNICMERLRGVHKRKLESQVMEVSTGLILFCECGSE